MLKLVTSRNSLRQALVAGLAAIGLLALLVTFTPLVPWWARQLAGRWEDPNGDVLIVLAGSGGDGRMIGYGSYLRTQYAILAYRDHAFATIVVAGGGDPVPQAEIMRDFMTCNGVPRDRIVMESASNTTRENAVLSKPLLDRIPGSKVLLTSDYHMFRARRAFEKAGIHVLPRPLPDAVKRSTAYSQRISVFLDLLTESAKIAYYYSKGWL